MKKSTFDINTIGVLLINEVRLRSRRLSSLFALLLMVAISWSTIPDPQSGMVMMALDGAKVAYTSSALAFGSAAQASMLLSLICFYLLRGRMSEDIRTGIGSIIATSSIKNSVFIISRWLGGVAYIFMLMLAYMTVILVLHILRGEGGIQIEVYLQTYILFFLPMAFLTSSFAILFDSIPFLMGKVGDIIYFILWVVQIGLIGSAISTNGLVGSSVLYLLFDFSGLGSTVSIFKYYLNTTNFSMGYSDFNAALTPIILPKFLWTYQIVVMRLMCAAVAMLPLLLAIPLFHRYSPDKVKASLVRERRSPLAIINQWSRPLAKQAHPLFKMAAKMPNFAGRVIAELGLTLVSAPFVIVVLIVLVSLQAVMSLMVLKVLAIISVVIWGIFISDISTRDYQAGIESMTSAIKGGAIQGFLRHYGVSCLLGFLFVGVIILRWSYTHPILAITMVVGIFSLSAIASFLGRCSRTPRTFLSLFLMWVYISTQTPTVSFLDVVGFNGSANMVSIMYQVIIALTCVISGYGYTKFKSRNNFS
jgi:hypothetical protein